MFGLLSFAVLYSAAMNIAGGEKYILGNRVMRLIRNLKKDR